MLILLSGSSGSGKNTVINELLKRNKNISFIKSCTTRKKRPNENNYIYLSKSEFDKRLANDEIFEHEEIHTNFYGILKGSIDEAVQNANSNNHFIKDIGVLGQVNIVRAFKDKVPILSIFLAVPKRELISRLSTRGETEIDLRLARMEFELGYKDNYDVVINNLDLEKTVTRIEKLVAKYSNTKSKNKEKKL